MRIFRYLIVVPWFFPSAVRAQPENRDPREALCGLGIVLLGDAWEHVQLERDHFRKLVTDGDLTPGPQRLAAMMSHLVFMQNRSVMVFGSARDTLRGRIRDVEEILPLWNGMALAGNRKALEIALPGLDSLLVEIAAQYPGEALLSSGATSFLLPPVVPTLLVRAQPLTLPEPGGEVEVRFTLTGPGGVGIPVEVLHTTHTEKLHALVLDPGFRDYHHAHPQPAGAPGEYSFRFTPRTPGPYRLWLDALPVATGRGEFPVADLMPIPRPLKKNPPPPGPMLKASVDGFRAELVLPGGHLRFGDVNVPSLILTDSAGQPVRHLQPWMGAFAHVVGFADDFQTIFHIHPLGAMPQPGQTGGPRIDFEVRPQQPGWMTLFVQFLADDRVRQVAFVVPVKVP